MREQLLDYSSAKNPGEARQRAMAMLSRLIRCHDFIHHAFPKSPQFDTNVVRTAEANRNLAECTCDTNSASTDRQSSKGSDTQ